MFEDKEIVQSFDVLRYYGDGQCECMAECSSHAQAVKAINYYGMAEKPGVYYRIELRYKVVQI